MDRKYIPYLKKKKTFSQMVSFQFVNTPVATAVLPASQLVENSEKTLSADHISLFAIQSSCVILYRKATSKALDY